MELHLRAAPLTFASGLGGIGDIAKKTGYCPYSSALLLAEICAANRSTPSPAQASEGLSALTEWGRRGDSSIFLSVGLNHFLGQEFLPVVGVSFSCSPQER